MVDLLNRSNGNGEDDQELAERRESQNVPDLVDDQEMVERRESQVVPDLGHVVKCTNIDMFKVRKNMSGPVNHAPLNRPNSVDGQVVAERRDSQIVPDRGHVVNPNIGLFEVTKKNPN